MQSNNRSRVNRARSNRRRSRKGDKCAGMKENVRSEELYSSSPANDEDDASNVEQKTLLDTESTDNGTENNTKSSSLMCPALHRQLQTHKNVLRLLHEYKLASTQINGQRILSIQPVRWSGPTPGIECEIFVGRIPKTIFEDTLYPLFNTVGEVFQIRLMVDMAELTRGYCFIMYTNPGDAVRAIAQLDQYEISPGKKIRVLASVNKCKLYIGPLPRQIASEEVVRVIYASAWDIEYVSIYRFFNNDAAYAIVSFKSHRNAALARRKLRPERLFKCNEVHVEWARIDWNPSNVHEDRGMVDDKGEVQITRKYIQFKKTSQLSSMQDYKHFRKQIRPICPPNNDNDHAKLARNGTRHSTMLNMSAMLDDNSTVDVPDNKVVTDINDNLQLSNGCRKKKDNTSAAEGFRNFDIWNSNLVPLSPANFGNLERYESADKALIESPCDWDNNVKYWPPKTTSSFGGYRCANESSISDCSGSYRNCSSNKTDKQTRPIATFRCQAPSHQDRVNQSVAPYYMLLHPPAYPYPNEVTSHLQSSLIAHAQDDQMRTPSSVSNDHWTRNGRVDVFYGSVANDGQSFNGKRDDCEFQNDGIVAKVRSNAAPPSPLPSFVLSNYAQSCAPNLLLNFTPIYALNSTYRSPLASMANGDKQKYLRPILKQTINHQL